MSQGCPHFALTLVVCKRAKVGNNSLYTLSQTFLLQQVAYTIDLICAKKKRFKLYWLRAGKNFNIITPSLP